MRLPRVRCAAGNPRAHEDGPQRRAPRACNRLIRYALLATLLLLPRAAWAQEQPAAQPTEQPTEKPEDELVEVIDEPGQAKPSNKAEVVPATPDKIEVRGFARTTLQLGLGDGAGPVYLNGASGPGVPKEERVGYERATTVNQMYLDVRYTRNKTFQAVLSGSLAYTAALMEGRAGEDLDSREPRSVLLEPLLREAYLGFYSDRVDLRLGQQRIVWGNSDGFSPNDVLNARDTRNRMQLDSEMVQIPTLAARADFDLGAVVLGIVAQPFFIPDKASIYGQNWSLVQPDAPRHVRKFFGTYGEGKDSSEIEGALVRSRTSAQSALEGASIGSSLRFHFGAFDASYYYHYGRDRSPFVYLDPVIAAEFDKVNQANPDQQYAVIYGKAQTASQAYGGPFVVQSIRRHHVGMDLATTIGKIVARFDGAVDSAATFYNFATLNSVARPTAQAVLGLEYQHGFGKLIVLEASYIRLLGPEIPIVPVTNQANDGDLLFVKENNYGAANVIRWTFAENIVVEMRSFLGISPFSYLLRPEIGYQSSNFTFRVGALTLEGESMSFGRYYRRNQSAYVTMRYSF